jgi:hypothetical protein
VRSVISILLLALPATSALGQATVTANIHNAPGWQQNHSYSYTAGPPSGHFVRVNAGAGWTASTSTWNPGSALNNYQLDVSSPVPCTSNTTGNGPTGTTTLIPDGTCKWNYVGPTDYVTITGWGFDSGKVWTTGTSYGYLDVVYTLDANLPVFQQITAGCTGTVKPTTSNINTQLSDGCLWAAPQLASIAQPYLYYTSQTNFTPMSKMNRDTFSGSISGTTLTITTPPATYALAVNQCINYQGTPVYQTAFNGSGDCGGGIKITAGSGTSWTTSPTVSTSYTGTFFVADELNGVVGTSTQFNVGLIWNDREYVSGSCVNSTQCESSPIQVWNHNYQYNDSLHGLLPPSSLITAGYDWGYPTTIKPALGEGFQDTFVANPTLALAGYNANYGVGLRGIGVEGFGPEDNRQFITGLQLKSDTATAFFMEQRSGNSTFVSHSILEGGAGAFAVSNGALNTFYDNLFVSHGTLGIQMDYGGVLVNNTFVCPDGTCKSAIDNTVNWINNSGTVVTNNLAFGFAHFISSMFYNNSDDWHSCTWNCVTYQGTNNITDVASSDGVGWDSCAFVSGVPSNPTYSCPPYSFQNNGWYSWAVPFKTGYTYYSSGMSANLPICGKLGGDSGAPVAGTCTATYGVSPGSVFTAWPGNYHILNTSAAYGGGAAFPGLNTYIMQNNPGAPYQTPRTLVFCFGTWPTCATDPNTPDIFGTTRPQGTRYDVGAHQINSSIPPALAGRFFFR